MEQTIFRTALTQNFTVLPNAMLRDSRLSFKARGILAMILTNKTEWVVTSGWLESQGTEGREAIRSATNELQQLGYALFKREKDEKGQFKNIWCFYDTPQPNDGNPSDGDQPTTGSRQTGNRRRETDDGKPSDIQKDNPEEQLKKEKRVVILPDEAVLWNEICSALPKVLNVSPARLQKLRTRRSDDFWSKNYRNALEKVSESDFCCGKNDRSWTATFDWLLQPDTVTRIMEGKYDNRGKQAKASAADNPFAALTS